MASDIIIEPGTDPAIMAELREAADYASKGVRDPAVFRKACEEMDRLAAKNAILYPGPDIGVEIIREMRDGRHFQGDE